MYNFSNDDENLALSKFESMLKSNKVYFFDSQEFEDIVYYYMDLGKMNLAKKAIELSLTQHPTSTPLKLIKVELLIYENKISDAERLLTSIEKIEPNLDEVYIQKAAILSKKDKHVEAVLQLEKALELTNDPADVHNLLGMEYLFLEKFDISRSHFENCLKQEKDDHTALYNVIYCYDMSDKNQEAIKFLNRFIDDNPFSEVAWHQLGRQYSKNSKFNEAIRAFDYAILIDDHFIGAYLEKGAVLEILKRYEEAISNYMFVTQIGDPTVFTYLQIANCYKKLDDAKMAIKYYHKAVQEDPMIELSWLELTHLYLKEDNAQKALYFIQKALEVDSNNCDYLNRFAEINIRLNLFEEAAKAFQESISLGDERLEVYLALTDVLHFIGDYKDALDILGLCNKLYPDTVEILYRLSGINFILRQNNDGLFYLENALKLDFSYHTILEELYPTIYNKEMVKVLIEKFRNNNE